MATSSVLEAWIVHNADRSLSLSARAPFTVHKTLLEHAIIDNPYTGLNDSNLRWIIWQDWTATAVLSIPSNTLQGTVYFLDFEGLDTVTDISVNGIHVATTNNQFRRYIFNITPQIDNNKCNEVKALFYSAPAQAKKWAKESLYEIPDGFGEFEARVQNGERYRNFIRKSQCSFSWDWGPCFSPVGVWQPAKLHVLPPDSTILRHVSTQITFDSRQWTIELQVTLLVNSLSQLNLRAGLLQYHSDIVKVQGVERLNEDGTITINVFLHIPEQSVQRWWPRGHGSQPLYQLILSKSSLDDLKATEIIWSKDIGFRTCELHQHAYDDRPGQSFYFTVNDKRIFIKGSNWVPVDAFNDRVTTDKLRYLINSVVNANMNMLRVWGGGQYQNSEFYDLCDVNGIMIWQEFMFACAMYPGTQEFLDNVREEVIHQVQRLSHHPCIALWSGNNENQEALIKNWYPATAKNPHLYTVDYHRLYNETIPLALATVDTTRSYVGTTPSCGIITQPSSNDTQSNHLRFPYIDRWIPPEGTNTNNWGDSHYFNYKGNALDSIQYPCPRMATEYGWMSMPSYSTWKKITDTIDQEILNPLSDFTVQRNHHHNGQQEIILQLQLHFMFPKISKNTKFTEQMCSNFCYLTQIMQAMIIRSQTEHYRRLRWTMADCMGAMYWQVNDIWPTPSWSSIDYNGKWKLLHYYMKEAFAPLHASVLREVSNRPNNSRSIMIHLINEYDGKFIGTLTVQVFDVRSSSTIGQHTIEVSVSTDAEWKVFIDEKDTKETQPSQARFIMVNIVSLPYSEITGFFSCSLCPDSWSSVMRELQNPYIKLNAKMNVVDNHGQGDDSNLLTVTLNVTVTVETLAFFVWLELKEDQLEGVVINGRFFENGFHMTPGQTMQAIGKFNLQIPETAISSTLSIANIQETLPARVHVRSLWDIRESFQDISN